MSIKRRVEALHRTLAGISGGAVRTADIVAVLVEAQAELERLERRVEFLQQQVHAYGPGRVTFPNSECD